MKRNPLEVMITKISQGWKWIAHAADKLGNAKVESVVLRPSGSVG